MISSTGRKQTRWRDTTKKESFLSFQSMTMRFLLGRIRVTSIRSSHIFCRMFIRRKCLSSSPLFVCFFKELNIKRWIQMNSSIEQIEEKRLCFLLSNNYSFSSSMFLFKRFPRIDGEEIKRMVWEPESIKQIFAHYDSPISERRAKWCASQSSARNVLRMVLSVDVVR